MCHPETYRSSLYFFHIAKLLLVVYTVVDNAKMTQAMISIEKSLVALVYVSF